ncbi:MAG: alanine--tRNA ligase [Clostridiales bacterium]|nr:alanine--tRNA ligase [Candidatus Cacconaster stercorequi]
MSHPYHGLNELRELFLSYFESKDHLRLPSFSLVPQNDKSILLINAGMTPMKPWFKGEEEPPRKRVCTCQKCIRTGDIDNVGKTARHGTYFEMLGNFSFGDYFKHDAINWSWEFLTRVVGLEGERLYPSIYLDDEQAFDIWHNEVGIPAEKITRLGKEDNFWEHGSGPCGPCSEIYYDRGEEFGCGSPDCGPGCDCDRYIEIWNNVFTQFDNDGKGNYTELAQKNIDTGMGLERLACVCQNVNSLFDVDTVMNITNKVSELTGAYYGQSQKRDVSLRVITDHIRSATFMICDGILPSNEGRGYVLRRLLRRAARHGKLLGVNNPFLYEVVATVIHENECQYPDLREKQTYITKVIRTEEENFARTIDGGMKIFADLLAEHKAKGEQVFSGADAFKLYDTFGFPIDLTREMAADEGLTVDEEAFQKLMDEQKVRAREARKALGDLGWAGIEFGKEVPSTEFVGYEKDEADCKVVAIIADDELREAVVAGTDAIVVLDKTPFYAEMGGQVADHGIMTADGVEFEVHDVQKNKGGKYMHYGKLISGELKVGDTVTATICTKRRSAIRRAHSATHLLQSALEKVLGDHVHQAGSLVEPDHLRFDFTHFSAVTAEEMAKVNELMEDYILDGNAIETMVLPIEEAKKLGATALFGEKYGETVRVVKMGEVSMEFCGGTHLDSTAKIGGFRIISESSVASGVRRIEMVTGKAVRALMDESDKTLAQVAETIKAASVADVARRAQQVMDELKEEKRVIEQYKAKESAGGADDMIRNAKEIGGVKVVTTKLKEGDANALRQLGDVLRDKDASIVAAMVVQNGAKITIQVVCGKEAVKKGIKAGDIIKSVAPIMGGKGGGKPDSAMGGGSDASKIDEALAAVETFVAEKL